MATVAEHIQKVYIGLLGRAADQAGLDYWVNEIESGALTIEQLRANIVNEQPEYLQGLGQMTRAQAVNQLYQNLFSRSADSEGLDYWVNGGGAEVNFDQLVLALINGAQAADSLALDNKATIAQYYTAAAGEDYTNASARAAIVNVDGNTDLAAARAAVDASLEAGAGETIQLTQRADNLQGSDGVNTTFAAPVTQNETGSGHLANTFETGDVLNGGANSVNELRADLIATGTINNVGVAISAETTNVQNVFFRAQQTLQDAANNTTTTARIDAEKMVGVEQWWTDNSRANVIIEDVRSRPIDTVLGMRNTDPEVDFEVYFNPLFMDGGQLAQSQLVIQIAELDGGVVNTSAELSNISVSALTFELDGQSVTLSSEEMAAADTWEELETAIVEALEAEGLGDLQVTRQDNGQFLLFDAEGRPFSNQGGFTASATTDQQIDIRNRITQDVDVQDQQTETTIVLDGVGNGSRGGDLIVGAMSGPRGVEVFNLVVDRDSHLSSARSTNSEFGTSFTTEMNLEEVYVTHFEGGAEGNLQLGRRTVDSDGISSTTDDRLAFSGAVQSGLVDVRVFDATGFSGEIKLAADLTESVFDKYLATAEEPVQFSYLLGDGGNNLNLRVDNDVASDPDFALEILGGASDDRINLTDLAVKNSTELNGAGGSNTVEINTTTGATADGDGNYTTVPANIEYSAAQTAFGSFENVDTLVIAGDLDTRQHIVDGNLTAIDGNSIVIATTDMSDTDIVASRIDTALSIDGKNQVLGAGNNNNAQTFGDIQILNTRPEPGTDSQSLTLQNAARLNGLLTVEELVIGTEGAGATNAISTLDLTSAGRRNTSNLVQDANLASVSTVNLDGTQDLDLHISAMASGASVVNGSALGGDLYLAINGGLLTGSTDVLTGTAGTADTLAVYGGGAQATVTAFETVQLGLLAGNQFNGAVTNFQGTFNAAAVSGVEQYSVQATGGATSLINLTGSEVVNVNAAGADNDLTLIAAARATANAITVNFSEAAGDWGNGGNTLSVQDFRTVTLGLEEGNYQFALDLVTANGVNAGTTYARTLNIVGGTDDPADTTLNIGALDTALTRVDLSGLTGSLVNAEWASLTGSNATVVVNEYDFSFDIGSIFTTIADAAAQDTIAFNDTASLDVAAGQTLIINFDGESFTYTNDSGAAFVAGNEAALVSAIVAQAKAQGFNGFVMEADGGNLVLTTADGTATGANAAIDAASTANDADEAVTNATGNLGDEANFTSEFVTTFRFDVDADAVGVVWQIDGFQNFDADGVTLGNATILDLRAFASSASDIVIQDGAAFWAGLTAAEQQVYDDNGYDATDFAAGNTVITSNEGFNYTILLNGVDAATLSNENILGIA